MRAENFLISLATLSVLFSVITATSAGPCGKFNVTQFENKAMITELDEHPWIGRIEHIDRDGAHAWVCVGVLIDARHVLTPAHCVARVSPEAVGLIFGDWNASKNNSDPDCDDQGVCAPPGQRRTVGKISIHPDYREREHQNDLAVVELDKDEELSAYVEPICLPLAEAAKSETKSTNLIVAGYQITDDRLGDTLAYRRHKMEFEVANSTECHEEIGSELICGKTEQNPFSGSALVKASGSPRKFYLDGIVVESFNLLGYFRGCVSIRSHIDWIRQNTSQ